MIASLATTAPARFLDAGGTRFAYRRFGTPVGTAASGWPWTGLSYCALADASPTWSHDTR
jgi:hypothetical protein